MTALKPPTHSRSGSTVVRALCVLTAVFVIVYCICITHSFYVFKNLLYTSIYQNRNQLYLPRLYTPKKKMHIMLYYANFNMLTLLPTTRG